MVQYLTTVDYILFILLMVGGIWGAIKGFLDEVSSKFGFVLGFLLALMYAHLLSPVFVNHLHFPAWVAAFTAYFLIFMAGYVLMKIFGSILSNIVDTAHLSVLDRILGFVLGLVEAFFLIAAFEYILRYQDLFSLGSVFEDSLFSSKLILPFADFFMKTIKSVV